MSADEFDRPARIYRRGYKFAQIPEWILFHPDLSGEAVRLYGILARYADSDGQLFPGQSTVAARLGKGERTVRRYYAELQQVGALEAHERRFQRTTIWILHTADPATRPDVAPQDRPDMTGQDRPDVAGHDGPDVAGQEREPVEREPDNEKPMAAAPPTAEVVRLFPEPQQVEIVDTETAKSRRRDLLFEALVESCGMDSTKLTKAARSGLNTALRDLREVRATPEEIRHKAGVYRLTMPEAALTPSALAKHWPRLDDLPLQVTKADVAGLDWLRSREANDD